MSIAELVRYRPSAFRRGAWHRDRDAQSSGTNQRRLFAYALFSITLRRLEAVGDGLHRRHRHVAESGETGKLIAHSFALIEQNITHFLQLKNDAVDFLYRSTGDSPDQLIHIFSVRIIGGIIRVASLLGP